MKTNRKTYFHSALIVLLLAASLVIRCKDDNELGEDNMRALIWTKYMECSTPTAIRIFLSCYSEGSQPAIKNYDTNTAITTSTVSNGTRLACECPTTGARGGNSWYKAPTAAMAPGTEVYYIGDQNGPFTNYAVGDTIICLTNCNSWYSKITITD